MSTFYVITFLLFLAATYLATPQFISIFEEGKALVKNYKGVLIPQGIGIIFPIFYLAWSALFGLIFGKFPMDIFLILLAVFSASFIGFIDDMLGARNVLGFKGHFGKLLQGKLTTGGLKAISGLLAAFVISAVIAPDAIFEVILNTLVIALFTNLFNLLDLRPGRSIKFFLILFIVFLLGLAFGQKLSYGLPYLPLAGIILGYFPYDLSAKCMMGDAGSNVIGMSMGILAASAFEVYTKILILILLIAVHIYTEKYSLTDLINKNRFLSFLDELGR